jgi:DnaJ-class molecular chaperone
MEYRAAMPRFSPTYPTAYHCLGLSGNVTIAEIRSTYKALAVQLHPDKAAE